MRRIAWVVLVVVEGIASAQPAPPPPGGGPPPPGGMLGAPVEPHQGLYLRLMLGGGYAQMTNSQTGQDVKIDGGSVALDIHIGYFVAPNLALGADLFGSGVQGPTLT